MRSSTDDPPPAPTPLPFATSLCHRCSKSRLVDGARTTFILCAVHPRKYPPQPVRSCPWYHPRVTLREAREEEYPALSELALRSKAHWGYSAEFLDACRAELTLTTGRDPREPVVVIEVAAAVKGFYALSQPDAANLDSAILDNPIPDASNLDGTTLELEALFVEPSHLRTGLGKTLITHALTTARHLGARRLLIQGDPNAEPFYLAVGAERIGTQPSASIPNRDLPLYEIPLPLP